MAKLVVFVATHREKSGSNFGFILPQTFRVKFPKIFQTTSNSMRMILLSQKPQVAQNFSKAVSEDHHATSEPS